jgi:glycosyltransferase involved in cell wall biosynthesis
MIAGVLHVRNEEFFLPGFLDSVRDCIDAFYCIDDGSTDTTVQILEKERKLKLLLRKPPRKDIGWMEQSDLEQLYEAVKNDGYEWIFTADPDERLSIGFLNRMKVLATMPIGPTVYVLKLCECWDRADHYRTDSIWNTKKKSVLFTVPDKVTMSDRRYHAPNYPLELRGFEVLLNDRAYHLKMVRPAERIRRRELYTILDPECRFQPIGYDYLTDNAGLVLTKIPEAYEYDFSTLPEAWKNRDYLSEHNCRKISLSPRQTAQRNIGIPQYDCTVSVIVASYNYGRFLSDAVESVLDQTLVPHEILIIDDCSQDNTLEIGEYYAYLYPERVKYHRNVRNLGIIENFRTAVSLSRGELICVLGADNRLRCDYLEKTYTVLENNPDVAVAYTDYVLFGSEAGHVYTLFPETWRGGREEDFYTIRFPEFDPEELKRGNYIHGSSLYRRTAYETVGGYVKDKNPDDYSLFSRMVQAGLKAYKANGAILEYRQHSENQANRQWGYQNRLEALEVGYRDQLEALETDYRDQLEMLEMENSRLKSEHGLIVNSRSWKITKPLRAVSTCIRNLMIRDL